MTNGAIDGSTKEFVPFAAVIAAGIALSIAVFFFVRAYYANAEMQRFQRDSSYYSTNFATEVTRHVTSLAAIHAFVSTSHKVTRWEFSSFAHQILPEHSGFKAVLWLPLIKLSERNDFERGLQQDGLYGLQLRELTQTNALVPARSHSTYFPVAYMEPFENNGDLIGVDLSNNDIYKSMFDEAARAGRAVASPPILHALVAGTHGAMVLVVFPLDRGNITKRPDQARNIDGYALGILQMDRLLKNVIGANAPLDAAIGYGPEALLSVFPAGASGATTLSNWLSNAPYHRAVPFDVAGTHLYLLLRSEGQEDLIKHAYIATGAAVIILSLTTILAQSMFVTLMGKKRVERAVLERTTELRELNLELNEEIEQRKQAEAALWIAKDKAEGANKAKSAFLATMSHELRTPLNAIIGFSSILVERPAHFDERSTDYLREINGSGVRLLDLINDILEITQMDTEEDPAGDTVYIPDIIEAAVSKMQSRADDADVRLYALVEQDLPPLRGDSRRLQKVLVNLLSNAIKFTAPRGEAFVTANSVPDGVTIEVIDTGIGMPPETEASIAGIFSQLDSSLSRKHEGIGLGLTFVRRVADHHGALLRVASKEGVGTRVALTFPGYRIVKAPEAA